MARTCDHCGALLEPGVARCHYCGAADEAKPAEPAAPKASTDTKADDAEKEIAELAARERALARAKAEETPVAPPSKKSPLRRMAVLSGVLVCVFLVFCPHVSMAVMGGPWRKAVTELGGCKVARDALGDDIHLSWLGFPRGSNHGGSGAFRLPVSGSKASGDLDYSFHGDQVEWTLFVADRHIVDDKACKANPSGGAPAASAIASKPAVELPLRVHSEPFLVDVNKDGRDDAVVVVDQSGSPFGYAALDGMTGKAIWRSQPIANERWTDKAFLLSDWLVIVSESGQLSGYDFVRDTPGWTTTVGERVEQLCEAPDGASVRVDVVGDRSFLVVLKTGGQSPMPRKAPCQALRSNRGYITPSFDRSTTAPRVGEHVECGSPKTRTGTAPDPCRTRAHVDPDALDGMKATSLWAVEDGFIVIGGRRPGAAYPMVGLLRGHAFVWKSDIPMGNPLLAREGAPSSQLSNGKIFVSYQTTADSFVTAFDVATGHRDWNAPFVKDYEPLVWASRETVFAYASTPDAFIGFATDTGARRFSLLAR